MAGLIGLGRQQAANAQQLMLQRSQAEFQRNQANKAMEDAEHQQRMQTAGMGAGMLGYARMAKGAPLFGKAAAGTAGGSTAAMTSTLSTAAPTVAGTTSTLGAGAGAGAAATGSAAGAGAGAGAGAAGGPYVWAAIAIGLLLKKLFD